jgi:hypothetical protein
MKRIPLTQGQFAIVDDRDYAELSKHKWHAWWSANTGSFYAVGIVNGKRIKMHRFILGFAAGDPRRGDHALHKTLDNRRLVGGKRNLKIASRGENAYNARTRCDNTSGFKGVGFHVGAYRARIRVDGRSLYLGSCKTPAAAHKLYAAAAKKYHGRFAQTN